MGWNKTDTAGIKGLAIMLMLWHHLFLPTTEYGVVLWLKLIPNAIYWAGNAFHIFLVFFAMTLTFAIFAEWLRKKVGYDRLSGFAIKQIERL